MLTVTDKRCKKVWKRNLFEKELMLTKAAQIGNWLQLNFVYIYIYCNAAEKKLVRQIINFDANKIIKYK